MIRGPENLTSAAQRRVGYRLKRVEPVGAVHVSVKNAYDPRHQPAGQRL
jgi:hypothetical protein